LKRADSENLDYQRDQVWSKEALERRQKMIEKLGLQAQAAKAEESADGAVKE
jgi:D-mannonate dehydratase